MSTFVLVHGGWHGGWVWDRVTPLLEGRPSHCPTLPGAPGAGLDTHVGVVVELLDRADLDEVVLVGHSSGGAVITGVAQRAAPRLRGLAYLDAFVPRPGQSVFDLLPDARRAHFRSLVGGDGRIVLDPDAAMDGWAVRDPADRAWLGPRLTPFPVGALSEPLPDGPVPDLPRQFVHATDKPGGDAFAGFAAAARDDPSWRLDVLDAGHDAMLTAPAAVAAALLAAWAPPGASPVR